MSYTLRNSIVLATLLVLVAVGGFYWVGMYQSGRIDSLLEHKASLRTDLDNINSALSVYDITLAHVNRLKARWQGRSQVVPARDTPARTLAYIDGYLDRARAKSVSFDFMFTGVTDHEDHSFNTYSLQGESRFEDLYGLIWHVENGQRFYAVDGLQIEYSEPERRTSRWDWIRFRIILSAYFVPESLVEDLPPLSESLADDQPGNPFLPLITQTLPSNRRGRLDVDKARLTALTEDAAYLVDRASKMHVLRQGDRVYLGLLDKIDMGGNRVEFLLNKGGIWERRTLRVGGAPR